MVNVLIIGSGGREHALAWKISKSPHVKKLFAIPGNPGISSLGTCLNVSLKNWKEFISVLKDQEIELVVCGPEAPLVDGLGDLLRREGIFFFGPSAKAAALEGSKVFAKNFCKKYEIPTADFDICETPEDAIKTARKRDFKCAVKADGLAAGKGVFVCNKREDVESAVNILMIDKKFGASGDRVVVEDLLVGREVSVMIVTDGENYYFLESSQDHKRLLENDNGPNTGGMGAFSPSSLVSENMKIEIEKRIIQPTLEGMRSEKNFFSGLLYVGIMIVRGKPVVLEFNVRFGDPETQPLMMRLQSDLFELLMAVAEGHLNRVAPPVWKRETSLCVVLVSRGYPGKYDTGYPIWGLDQLDVLGDVMVFHAGTTIKDGQIVTNGGRVLGVTSLGKDIYQATNKVYSAINNISFENMFFRKDIGRLKQ